MMVSRHHSADHSGPNRTRDDAVTKTVTKPSQKQSKIVDNNRYNLNRAEVASLPTPACHCRRRSPQIVRSPSIFYLIKINSILAALALTIWLMSNIGQRGMLLVRCVAQHELIERVNPYNDVSHGARNVRPLNSAQRKHRRVPRCSCSGKS